MLDGVLGDAADSVASHLCPGAVGVVDLHAELGGVGRTDQNQAVAADAGVTIGHMVVISISPCFSIA